MSPRKRETKQGVGVGVEMDLHQNCFHIVCYCNGPQGIATSLFIRETYMNFDTHETRDLGQEKATNWEPWRRRRTNRQKKKKKRD